MPRRRRPEDAIQRAVFQHIKARGVAGLVAIHVPLGGYRKPVEAKILQGLGVTAGVPDVLLWPRRQVVGSGAQVRDRSRQRGPSCHAGQVGQSRCDHGCLPRYRRGSCVS